MKNRYKSFHSVAKAGLMTVSLVLAVVTVEWIVLGCAKRAHITGRGDYRASAGFRIGERVSCRWRAGARRYNGTVRNKSGGRLYVVYDDGGKEYIAPEFCLSQGGGGGGAAGVAPAAEAPVGRGLDKVRGETPAEPPAGGGSPPPSRPASDPAGEPDL